MSVQSTNTFYQTGSLQTFDLICELFLIQMKRLIQVLKRLMILKYNNLLSVHLNYHQVLRIWYFSSWRNSHRWNFIYNRRSCKVGCITRYLYLINMTGNFTVGEILTGSTSTQVHTRWNKQTTDELLRLFIQIESGVTEWNHYK